MPEKPLINLDKGAVLLKDGSVVFGKITEDEKGFITVTTPTATGEGVRTIRHYSSEEVAQSTAIKPAALAKLAKVGPFQIPVDGVRKLFSDLFPQQQDQPAADPKSDEPTTALG